MQIITSVFLITTWSLVSAGDDRVPRVYLGTSDDLNKFPYVVSLQALLNPMIRLCSGSLVSETWVLTAGHCTSDHIPLIVRYADFTVLPNETKAFVKVIDIFQHPGFKITRFSVSNDNALILTEKVPVKTFGKISALDYKALLGLPVKYAGFGRTHRQFASKSLNLLDLKIDLLRPLLLGEGVVVQCISARPITGPLVCVAPKCSNSHQGARPGDSGGPLVQNGKIVGVLTGAFVNEGANAMYAPVSPNLQWIHDVMFTHKLRNNQKEIKF